MTWIRHWMPLAICVAGVLVLVLRGFDETGWEAVTLLVAAGSSVWMLNIFYRLGVRGDEERDVEDAARDFFDAHGHWPDEGPSAPPGPPEGPDPPAAPGDPHRPGQPPRAGRTRVPGHGPQRRR